MALVLDALINNAGVAAGGIQESFTTEQTRAMSDVNVFGVKRVTGAALALVEIPVGQRPERVVVGLDFGAVAANNAIAPIRANLVAAIGMSQLDMLKIA